MILYVVKEHKCDQCTVEMFFDYDEETISLKLVIDLILHLTLSG